MKKILLLVICLLSMEAVAQDDDENIEIDYGTDFTLERKGWKVEEFVPDEDNQHLDTLTKIQFNPYINVSALDSILRWRDSKGCGYLDVDISKVYNQMRESAIEYSMFNHSEIEKSKVLLRMIEDPIDDCTCSISIANQILDDSLFYGDDNFKKLLLDDNITYIEVDYFQVERKPKFKYEQHLYVKIKRKYRLFKTTYQIM